LIVTGVQTCALPISDGVAPGAESARPILYACFPRYLGDFVLWNKIANLPQKVKPTTCWFDAFFVFHPCRVAGSKRQANTFFIFCGMAVNMIRRYTDSILVTPQDQGALWGQPERGGTALKLSRKNLTAIVKHCLAS